MASVVIMGAGPAGLATAMLLAEARVDVTVLEKDPTEPPETATLAWKDWQRPGVAQFRQIHVLHSNGREILQRLLPGVWNHLESLEAHPFNLLESAPPTISEWTTLAGDDRFRSLGARRPIYELAYVLAARDADVDVRRGVSVSGLKRGPEVIAGVPHVTGVETSAGEVIEADLVIDAAGRRSPLPSLLEAIGARPVYEDAQDSRFVYYSRYYAKRDAGDFPRPYVPFLLPVGSISILTLPGDNATWSATLYATTADKAMRAARDPDVFEEIVRRVQPLAHWLGGDPITDVMVMAGISDRERSLIVDGSPGATGVIPVADAWACTNPSLGRGITMGMMHIEALLPALLELMNRPDEMVHAWHGITEEQLQPWHRATLAADRARNREMEAIRAGAMETSRPSSSLFNTEDPEQASLAMAMMTDQHVYRAAAEWASILSTPEEIMSRPEIQNRVAAVAEDMPELPPAAGPTREELESLLG